MPLPAVPRLGELRQRAREVRYVTADHLNVSPQLLGATLAQPGRRLAAILIDGLVVGLLSEGNGLLLLAGLAWVVFNLRNQRSALTLPPKRWRMLILVALIGMVGGQSAWNAWQRSQAVKPALHAQAPKKQAAKVVTDTVFDAKVVTDAAFDALPTDQKIEMLQAQLEAANEPKVLTLKDTMLHWADELGLGFGWAIVYFSLVPMWLPGQTLGKKLLKVKVVSLTGAPLTILSCFSRYGGYAAGAATGLFGFAQVYWDPNRQAIQDKIAHTVVLDLRQQSPDATLPGNT